MTTRIVSTKTRSKTLKSLTALTALTALSWTMDARAADLKPAAASATESNAAVSSDNRALAEVLFFTARGMMEAQRYPEACQKLAESYRLDPAAGTLLNLAVCHEKQGKIASAWGEFSQSASDARRANRTEREELAKEHAAALEPDLPIMAINVPNAVKLPGLTISRNGVALNAAAWDTELPVDPGEVEIVASAPGYSPGTTKVKIEKRQHLKVAIAALELAPIAPEDVVFWTGKRKTGALIGAAGLAAIGVGAIVGVGVLDNRQKSDDGCQYNDGVRRCTQAGADAMSAAKTGAWITDIAMGVGIVGVATGAYLFFTGAQQQERPPMEATKDVAWNWRVNVTPSGERGVVEGTF